MATVVNNPSGTTDSGNGMGFLFGVILILAFLFLAVVYGLPLLRSTGGNSLQAPGINLYQGK